jgi:hypothetical protein
MTQPQGSSGMGCLFGMMVALAGLAWIVAVFALPHYKMGYTDVRRHANDIDRVSLELALHLPDTADTVIQPLLDESLDVFVPLTSFESIPYPERENFLVGLADLWCESVNGSTPLFLPFVRLRNIRSGSTIARKSCMLSSPPDLEGSYSGMVHNETVNQTATFSVQMIDQDKAIKGCMEVGSPLIGTGPIVGSLSQRRAQFDLDQSGMHIRFEGNRIGHTIKGTYVVTGSTGRQHGEFSLHQDSIRVTPPNAADLDHCSR